MASHCLFFKILKHTAHDDCAGLNLYLHLEGIGLAKVINLAAPLLFKLNAEAES